MIYLGDFPASHIAVCIPFDSFAAATGAPSATTNFAAGDVTIYKDGGTTQRSSSAGITVSTSFDSLTGLQMIVIDLSDNTDAGFYAAGHEYTVAVADITVDSQTVRFWAASFSIERAGGILALLKGATGLAAIAGYIDTEVGAIKTQTDKMVFTVTNQLDVNVLDWKSATAPAMTGDAFARLGAPAGASVSADIATVAGYIDTEVGAIKTQTDKMAFTVTNQLDVNVLDWKSATAPAMTGDAFARLGAPAGASVSADLATIASYVDTEIGDIQARLPAALTANGLMKSDTLRVGGTVQTAGDLAALLVAIKAVTDLLPNAGALSNLDAAITSRATPAQILTTALSESYSAKGGTVTLVQALYHILSVLEENAIAATTMTTKKRDGSTTAATYTLNDATTPTAVTRAT